MGESFIVDHSRRSVLPERLADILLTRESDFLSGEEYYHFTHFTDALMTDQEIVELPKVWVVGGDGGIGDIGYQNTSKVMLQNRPNVKVLMLDTQVYSNTGGQNSDSTPHARRQRHECLRLRHTGQEHREENCSRDVPSPATDRRLLRRYRWPTRPSSTARFSTAWSIAGTMFLQCFTTCQPEHGVADDMALFQAQRVRDSRGAPEFVFNPRMGETYQEALDIKGNPSIDLDWYETKSKVTSEPYRYTVAHWCVTEARFRNHLKKIKPDQLEGKILLDNMLMRITQQDVVYRYYLLPEHRSFIPDFGVYISFDQDGKTIYYALSRQLVMFCVERRKAWRMLQSKAGVVNREYQAQKAILADLDAGKIAKDEFFAHAHEIVAERLGKPVLAKA
ncbi:MAG: thiamine pyrophosphate-dependent enzyme [Terracidiphilus sp.]